jgi:hypothetical protein
MTSTPRAPRPKRRREGAKALTRELPIPVPNHKRNATGSATITITTKQIGDGGEYLVAGLLTLGGTPTTKMLDNQPGFDLIALPIDGRPPQRVSVKTARSKSIWIAYKPMETFDWLAIVLADGAGKHRVFVIPRAVTDERQSSSKPTSKFGMGRFCDSKNVPKLYPEFENNFTLDPDPARKRA